MTDGLMSSKSLKQGESVLEDTVTGIGQGLREF